MEKQDLFVSFSGGKTSAFMCHYLIENYSDKYKFTFGFANTSKEREETLEFVDRCDKHFNLNLVWLEAVFHQDKGEGTTHSITNFTHAKRKGEIFRAMCAKYGIPNLTWSHCTRELKKRPMDSYLKEIQKTLNL